jgi:hypothetical protein
MRFALPCSTRLRVGAWRRHRGPYSAAIASFAEPRPPAASAPCPASGPSKVVRVSLSCLALHCICLALHSWRWVPTTDTRRTPHACDTTHGWLMRRASRGYHGTTGSLPLHFRVGVTVERMRREEPRRTQRHAARARALSLALAGVGVAVGLARALARALAFAASALALGHGRAARARRWRRRSVCGVPSLVGGTPSAAHGSHSPRCVARGVARSAA